MDSQLNKLSSLIDFDNALIPGQMPNENAFRSAPFKDLAGWLQGELDIRGAELLDPVAPGTQAAPSVIPPGPEDSKGKFEPQPGFYQGFPEVTSERRWYFYWNTETWSLKDMGPLPTQPVADDFGDSASEGASQRLVTSLRDSMIEEIDYSTPRKLGAIQTTGAIGNSSNSDISDPIPVELGDIVIISAVTGTSVLPLAGYSTDLPNAGTFKEALLTGGDYADQRVEITNPDINFVVASSRNELYPGNTKVLSVRVEKAKIDIVKEEVNKNAEDISVISDEVITLSESIKPVEKEIQGDMMLGRVIRTTDGVPVDISSSGFPNTSNSDFIKTSPGSKVSVSGWFGSTNGIAGYNAAKVWNSKLADTSNTSIFKVEYADDFEITIPADVEWIRGGTKDRDAHPFKVIVKEPLASAVQELNSRVEEVEKGVKARIIIRPISSSSFNVMILNEATGKYTTHRFIRSLRTNDVGTSLGLVTEDIWYPNFIIVDGNNVAQGNLNFIYRLDAVNFPNEFGHVGAGHGCVVARWTKFFADGKEFDPTTLVEDISCDKFKFKYFADCYALNQSATTDGANGIPQLDGSGNPIVANSHGLDATYYNNGRIEHRNRLYIKRANTRFDQLHAAMNSCFRPYFDKVDFPNSVEHSVNRHYVSNGNVVVEPIDGSTINTGVISRFYSNEVTQRGADGYPYILKTSIFNMDNSKQKNANMLFYYSTSPNWLKDYLMPVICTANVEGNSDLAEVFNVGDVIDVLVVREVII